MKKRPDARNATARDFDTVAHQYANAFWIWLVAAAVVFLLLRWWALVPVAVAVFQAFQSLMSTRCAIQLRRGTYPIPNPNNGAPDGDAANLSASRG